MKKLGLLDKSSFEVLAGENRQRCGSSLFAVDPGGKIVFAAGVWPGADGESGERGRELALREAWRWGTVGVAMCDGHLMVWAVPLTLNNQLVGGLLSVTHEMRVLETGGDDGAGRIDIRAAGAWLRERCEALNLTNADALAARRASYEAEQQRAYVLHDAQSRKAAAIRSLYTLEERGLFAAIRAGDRGEARNILNRILVAVYHYGGGNVGLLKGFLLELVASMFRSAIEVGAVPDALWGGSFASLANFAGVETPEAMASWVRRTLEQLMDAVPVAGSTRGADRLARTLALIGEKCHEPLTLAAAAKMAGLSPSRFCAILKQETGTTFTSILNRMRVDRAAAMLSRSDASIGQIALRCGFADQSYFTRVFRTYRGCAPRAFRLKSNRLPSPFFSGF